MTKDFILWTFCVGTLQDPVDADFEGAGGGGDIGGFAGLLVHQGGADRGLAGDLAFLEVHLVGAHDGVGHMGAGGEIRELHLAEQ